MNSSKRIFRISAAVIIFFLIMGQVSCAEDKPETTTLAISGLELEVEVARTAEERSKGLMFREEWGSIDGMLFIFEEDRRLSFWMKNTLLPLSIAYISHDGTIREIYDMEPGSLEPVESVRSVRYALEVPRGFFARNHVSIGDRIIFEEGFER